MERWLCDVDCIQKMKRLEHNVKIDSGAKQREANDNITETLKAHADETIFAHDSLQFAPRGTGRNLIESCTIG